VGSGRGGGGGGGVYGRMRGVRSGRSPTCQPGAAGREMRVRRMRAPPSFGQSTGGQEYVIDETYCVAHACRSRRNRRSIHALRHPARICAQYTFDTKPRRQPCRDPPRTLALAWGQVETGSAAGLLLLRPNWPYVTDRTTGTYLVRGTDTCKRSTGADADTHGSVPQREIAPADMSTSRDVGAAASQKLS